VKRCAAVLIGIVILDSIPLFLEQAAEIRLHGPGHYFFERTRIAMYATESVTEQTYTQLFKNSCRQERFILCVTIYCLSNTFMYINDLRCMKLSTAQAFLKWGGKPHYLPHPYPHPYPCPTLPYPTLPYPTLPPLFQAAKTAAARSGRRDGAETPQRAWPPLPRPQVLISSRACQR